MERIGAVVLAAGSGKRMGADIPKQYLALCGKPVMVYCLEAFEKSRVDEIVLVVAPGDRAYCRKEIVEKYDGEIQVQDINNIFTVSIILESTQNE